MKTPRPRTLLTLGILVALTGAIASSAPAQGPATFSARDDDLGIASSGGMFNLVVGHRVTFSVVANPGDVAIILVSPTPPAPPVPVLGGVPLAVDPTNLAAFPPALVPAGGVFSFPFTVPLGFAPGVQLHMQALLFDPSTAALGLTNGLVITVTGEPLENVDQGLLSGHPLAQGSGGALLIAGSAAWSSFWRLHKARVFPVPPVPRIDFGQRAVVAVFAGLRPTGGFSLAIDLVRRARVASSPALVVEATQTAPGPGCLVTHVITHPFHIVTIPAVSAVGPIARVQTTASVTICFP